MIIETSSCDMDIIMANAGTTGKVHSLYNSAITFDFKGTMITVLPEERGEGPGFVLISSESGFPPRTLLKPGDRVEIDEDCSQINAGALKINMKEAIGFSSLLVSDGPETFSAGPGSRVHPSPGGDISTTCTQEAESPCFPIYEDKEKDEDTNLKQHIRLIGEYFLNAENVGNSILSRVVPELLGASLQCSIGSCVLSVWREAVDSILRDLKCGIEAMDGEMFGENLKKLVGMGWGLTPGGDDFILGMLGFTSFILRQEAGNSGDAGENSIRPDMKNLSETFSFVNLQIRNHLPALIHKTGYVSGAYLKYALEGRYVRSFITFMESFMQKDRRKLEESLEVLTKHGATSGMDIIAGVLFVSSPICPKI